MKVKGDLQKQLAKHAEKQQIEITKRVTAKWKKYLSGRK